MEQLQFVRTVDGWSRMMAIQRSGLAAWRRPSPDSNTSRAIGSVKHAVVIALVP